MRSHLSSANDLIPAAGNHPLGVAARLRWWAGLCFLVTAAWASAAPTATIQSPTRNVLALGDTLPIVTVPPSSQTASESQPLVLSVAVTGAAPMTFQWRKSGVDLIGATTSTLSFPSLSSFDAGSYDVVITNYLGSTTSTAATLTIAELPAPSPTDPTYRVIQPGTSTVLVPAYSGPGAQSYQWFRNGRMVAGATGATLPLVNATATDSGYYFADIGDASGIQRSPPIFVSVVPAKTQVRAWGLDAQLSTLDSIIAIAANPGTGLGLKRNGVLTQLGSGGIPLPVGLSGAVAVSGSFKHALALKKDGTVVAWGDNFYGQSSVPGALTRIVAVSAGRDHSLALRSDGTVVAWGSNAWNQCNVPASLSRVVAIFAGDLFSLAVTDDGKLVTWGSYSQPSLLNAQTDIAAVASYPGFHLALLKQDGTVVIIGGNEYGQSNVPVGLTNVKAIAAGTFHTLALKADGTVTSWGLDSGGQATVPPNLATVFAVSAGPYSSYALRDSTQDTPPQIVTQPATQTVIETGKVTFSVTVTGPGPYSYQWFKNGTPIAGATTSTLKLENLALSDAGTYEVSIINFVGPTFSAPAVLTVQAIPVITALSPIRQVIASGQSVNLSVTATGTGPLSYQWLHNGQPIAGATSATLTRTNFTRQSAGYYLVQVTDSIGTRIAPPIFLLFEPGTGPTPLTQIRPWGINSYGSHDIPAGLTDAVDIATASFKPLALRANGTVVGWGISEPLAPTPAGLNGVVGIALSEGHSAAVKSDGTVVAWGDNSYLQCDVPAGLANVVSVACGPGYTLALKADGTVIGWGGQRTNQSPYNPIYVQNIPAGLKNVVAILALPGAGLALRSDGKLVKWTGTTWETPFVVQEESSDIISMAGANRYGLLRRDGTVQVVTNNAYDNVPYVPAGLANVVALFGAESMFAIKADGTVVGWHLSSDLELPEGIPGTIKITDMFNGGLVLRDASADSAPTLPGLANQTVIEGAAVSWTMAAGGAGPFTYQWRKNGVAIAGATARTLALTKLLPADSGAYEVVVTNYKGATTSSPATLTVKPLPVITSLSPVRQTFTPGENLALAATATGTGPLNYQWIRNGRIVPGATSVNFAATKLSLPDSGWYAVDVTDDNGTRRSKAIFVTVAPATTKAVGWGFTNTNATTVSSPTNDLIAVSAGADRTLALRRNGTVLGFGGTYAGEAAFLAGLTDLVAVDVGWSFSLALRSDGTVVAWSNNSLGAATVPTDLKNVVAISAGASHALALTAEGQVIAWGDNSWNQISVPAGLAHVVAIAAGDLHSLAVKDDGTVVAWGSSLANPPVGLSGVVAVAAGASHSLALRSDGTAIGWGSNAWSQATVPSGENSSIVGLAGGFQHSYLLKGDGTVYGWGSNVGYTIDTPPGLSGVFQLSSKSSFTVTLVGQSAPAIFAEPVGLNQAEQQSLRLSVGATGLAPLGYQWRKNGVAIPGATSATFSLEETTASDAGNYDVEVTNSLGSTVSKVAVVQIAVIPQISAMSVRRNFIAPGDPFTLSIAASGTGTLTYQWFHNRSALSGATSSSYNIVNAVRADRGWYHVEITDANGTRRSPPFFVQVSPQLSQLTAWGTLPSGSVSPPPNLTDATMIAAGGGHSLVVRKNGTVLGLGVAENPAAEQSVLANLSEVVAVDESELGFSLALKSDGTVVAWGRNEIGQTNVPPGLGDVVAIAAGGRHALALKGNGTVVAWGQNTNGQTAVPAGLSDVVGITAGATQSLAIKRDGTIVPWGSDSTFFVGFPNLTQVTSASAAGSNWLALSSTGVVTTWGYSVFAPYPALQPPAGLASVLDVAAGPSHALALKSDGTVVGWGLSSAGATTPPANLSRAFTIAAGNSYSLALSEVIAPTFSLQPLSQTRAVGDRILLSTATSGWPVPTLQWLKDGVPIAGATSSNYTVAHATLADTGTYAVTATNFGAAVASNSVTLIIVPNQARSDFNSDGKPDLIWSNSKTGERALWLMNGTNFLAASTLGIFPLEWTIAATGDFNADGKPDLVWSNSITGERALWLMNGTNLLGVSTLGIFPLEWTVAATADFNADGNPDIIWSNSLTGERAIWLMNGTNFLAASTLGIFPLEWTVAATGDFNADGKPDIIWSNSITGERAIWLMNGTNFLAASTLGTFPLEWTVAGTADFNADGKPDIIWSNSITGERALWLMNGTNFLAASTLGIFPLEWTVSN